MFDLIKENVNIVRHIEKYTELHKAGRLLQGYCPIHGDKSTPSLTVYPNENSWYCFGGCHAGGSVIDFEALRQKVSPFEAAKFLCEEYSLHPTVADNFKFQQRMSLRKQKQDWLDALFGSFTERPDIYQYVVSRGLSEATVKEFELGAGNKTNVLVIPIKDKFGRIAGFARRNLDKDAQEKYLNDASDPIYNKSEILFNYDKAKYHIKEHKKVVLNEGYFDVMSLWDAGIKHSVAFCSSRLTLQQARLIQDIVEENGIVYLVPTNDPTAQEALEKNRAQLMATCPGNQLRTLVIPADCKDLNDVLIKYGKGRVAEIYNASIPIELYMVKRVLDTEPLVESQYAKVKTICSKIASDMILDDICGFLASKWSKPIDMVRAFLKSKKDTETIDTANYKSFTALAMEYDKYIETMQENRINFGWHKTDMITRGMRIGDVVQMIATTGVGKTLWAENLILNLTKQYPDLPLLFFSLEQLGIMAFERFMMMEGELESREIEKWSANDDEEIKQKLFGALDNLTKQFKSFAVVEESGMDLAKLEQYVVQSGMRIFNRPVKIIVIDYLGYLRGEGNDVYQRVSEISKQQKELAKRLKCVVISLHQVSKIGKTGGDPIKGYMARDSGVVQESADIMIGAWRPELQEKISEDKKKDLEGVYMTEILKNKYGRSGDKVEFYFHKKYLKLLEKRDETPKTDEKGRVIQ